MTWNPEWANRRRLVTAREVLSEKSFAKMRNRISAEDPSAQILSVWIAKEELRTLLATARVGGDGPFTVLHIPSLAVKWSAVIYGVGGGSLLSPILVGRRLPVSTVAPAALTSTLVTSLVGATMYTALATTNPGLDIAPDCKG